MAMVSEILGSLIGVLLIAAALTYVFSPHKAFGLLKKAGIVLLVLMLGPSLLSESLRMPDSPGVLPALALVSLSAYVILQFRLRHSRRRRERQRMRGAERKPLLPHSRDEL